jgi:trimeric autotransporter adhesin
MKRDDAHLKSLWTTGLAHQNQGPLFKRIVARQVLLIAITMMVLSVCAPGAAFAATPLAGTVIGNQASATYTDASAVSRTATSNTVQTIVQQVAAMTLTANGSKTAAPGTQVVFPHTLTNTGNGSDTFSLTSANLGGDSFDFASISFYADADGNGVADNTTPVTSTGLLAAGGVFRMVAVATAPAGATAGQTGLISVSGTSVFSGAVTASNIDTTTVSTNAVINVTKAISVGSGASPSGPYTYTLTYTNTGNATATGFRLTDAIPVGMTYVATSGRWSTTGATVLTDANSADAQGTVPNTVIYDFGVTTAGTVTAVINQVAPGVSGTVTFQVNVNSAVAPGTINNSAAYQYNDGAASVGPFSTNTVGFTINQTATVVLDDNPLQAGDATLNDIVEVASATQGATVVFNNRVHNNGNGTDTFDITVSGSTFPAGTTFSLFQSDAVTPLVDSNGNGKPDTGPVAQAATYTVVVKAVLPPGSTGGPYNVTVTGTSIVNAAISDTVTDRLLTITGNTVDVTNTAALPGAPGAGAGPEGAPVTTNSTNPGTTTTFTLFVNNTSSVSDTYDLAASTDSTFAALTLPTGWTVVVQDTGGTVITNTGVILANGNKQVNAVVTIPAGFAAGNVEVFFRAQSPTTGASDRKHDRVTVNSARSITITPNNTGQVFPSGSVVFSHTITNAGNVLEGNGVVSSTALALSNNQAGWSATLYWDTNNNGVLDVTDPVVSDLTFLSGGTAGLAPGETATLFVKVVAPSGAAVGAVNATTLTATMTNGTYVSVVPPVATATDTSTVIAGQVGLLKEHALDAACDGTADTAFGTANITVGAIPGACIRYRITATNLGVANVTTVVVSDATPPNTTYTSTVPAATTVGTITAPANGATGTFTATVGTLTPGQTAVVTFGARINP